MVRTDLDQFRNIMETDSQPKSTNNIFFLETKHINVLAQLTVRQACTVESTARNNPNLDVYVIFACSVGFERNDKIFQKLGALPNVHMRLLSWPIYANDTPAELWAHSSQLYLSFWPETHVADFLRLLLVYRFGGMYMNMDFVTLSSFDSLPESFLSQEQPGAVSISLLRFAKTGIGRLMSTALLQNFVNNFNGSCLNCNGLAVISRVLESIGQSKLWHRIATEVPVAILPSEYFFPIYFTVWEQLFQTNYTNATLAMMSDKTLGVHMWNSFTADMKVGRNESSVYAILARTHCPNVLATVQGEYF